MASFVVHFSELIERKREKQKTTCYVQVEEKSFKYTKTSSSWAAFIFILILTQQIL